MPDDIDFLFREYQRRRNEDYQADHMAGLFVLLLWVFNIAGIFVLVLHILGMV